MTVNDVRGMGRTASILHFKLGVYQLSP